MANMRLTASGKDLLSRAMLGTADIEFTHIELGDGADAGENANALSHTRITTAITSVSPRNDDIFITVHSVFDNSAVSTGFQNTELGLFAKDPDDATREILYGYRYSSSETSSYIPSVNEEATFETVLDIHVYVGEAENVTVQIVSGVYATQADLTAHTNDATKHVTATERAAWNGKQDALTFDATPTAGSENPVESQGIKEYVDESYTIAGKKSGTTLGEKATAEGKNTTASGDYSHAEGEDAVASGSCSHAEGVATATGDCSHAEGDSTASGASSHSEGSLSTAEGWHSHVEGEGTIANHRNQHVFGRYNLPDPTPTSGTSNPALEGKYVEIVGNGDGDSENQRKNARTLDWDGNEVLAGSLTLGNDPSEPMEAVTKQYVDQSVGDVDAFRVGDIKFSMAAQSNKWLECDGSTISSAAYANLIQLLRSQPQIKNLKIPPINTSIPSGTEVRPVGVCYHDGVWVICGILNDGNEIYRPMVYTTDDLYGEWTEVRLSMDDQYDLYGVCYDDQWDEWIAYGCYDDANQVSYPYFFHAADPTGSWTGVQLSTGSGIITSGTYENGTLILTVDNPGNVFGSQVYSNLGTGKTAESFSASAVYNLRFMDSCHYAGGVWVAAGGMQGGLHYATNPIGDWTDIDIGADCYAFAVCYCDGTWVAVGDQVIDGERYKRIWASTDVSNGFSDCGISGVGRMEDVFFNNGVIVAVAMDGMIYTSTDCSSFAPLQSRCGAYATIYRMNSIGAANGTFVICHESGASAVYLAQSGAVLPDITPEYGKAYIRALP